MAGESVCLFGCPDGDFRFVFRGRLWGWYDFEGGRFNLFRANFKMTLDDSAFLDDEAGGTDVTAQVGGLGNLHFSADVHGAPGFASDGQVGGFDFAGEGSFFADGDVAGGMHFSSGVVGVDLVVLNDDTFFAMGAEDGHGFAGHFNPIAAMRACNDLLFRQHSSQR